jgi:hypothetical protein
MKLEQLVNDLGNSASNQVVVTNRVRIFFSYGTPICKKNLKTNVLTIGKKYRYSKTTMKHLLIYLRDYEDKYVRSINDVDQLIERGVFKHTNRW